MPNIIGVRREDKNPWERRVPLIPSHMRDLRQEHGLSFVVQPSTIRIFRDEDYRMEGVPVAESLEPCSVILAVKEVPIPLLEAVKTYLFFSHTIKGQAHNMPMLRRLMELGCTLIDYEKITDEQNRRLLFFGRQAGQAGMVDTLWALGRKLDAEGVANPFSGLLQTYHYTSLVEAKEEIAEVAHSIRTDGLPESLVPFICGFTGYGHVSQGAQEIFDLLPMEEVPPERFGSFLRQKNYSAHRVYKTVFREEHLVRPSSPRRLFELKDYYENPSAYEPLLESYLPHLTLLLNGIYWAPVYPRFVSKAFIRELYAAPGQPRLRVVGDISCDIEGGVELTVRSTDPADPVFIYDPAADAARPGFAGRGPVIMAVDNLPAEIPLESSVFFSQALKGFLPFLAQADFGCDDGADNLPAPLRRAMILSRGLLTPAFAYLREFLNRESPREEPHA
jgi:saccharopine dehydrogenase (NAD+, L-lysine forming)